MKVLKIAAVSILALGLVLGVALPGLAASDSASLQAGNIPCEVLRGRVVSIDDDQEFVIQSGEQELTISVNGDTRYFKLCVPGRIVALAQYLKQWRHQNQEELGASAGHQMGMGHQNQKALGALAQHQMKLRLQNQIPQPGNVDMPELKPPNLKQLRCLGEEATFGDIAVGDRVAVRAVWGEDSYLAKTVVIMKPTTYARVSGTVSNIDEANMEIAIEPLSSSSAEDGEIILAYDSHTTFSLRGTPGLQQGERVVAIYMERDDGTLLAKRVMSGVELLELAQ